MDSGIMLGVISFVTSTVAALLGLGGGMLLIAVMPLFLPPQAIVPLHAVTQLSSNGSRAFFAWRHIDWSKVVSFAAGSVLGITLFSLVLLSLPVRWIPVFIGSYILLTLWCPPFDRFVRRYETVFSAGFFQTGMGLVVGATGPLTLAILSKQLTSKEAVIATSAIFMLLSHMAKIVVFGVIGFVYIDYLSLILLMVAGAILGSWVGTKLRRNIDNDFYGKLLKWLLSGLAIHMLFSVIDPGGIF